jgi:hypothetical protein
MSTAVSLWLLALIPYLYFFLLRRAVVLIGRSLNLTNPQEELIELFPDWAWLSWPVSAVHWGALVWVLLTDGLATAIKLLAIVLVLVIVTPVPKAHFHRILQPDLSRVSAKTYLRWMEYDASKDQGH